MTSRSLVAGFLAVALTRLVQDIAPGRLSEAPASLTTVGKRLYFTADDGATGRELWTLAASAAGEKR